MRQPRCRRRRRWPFRQAGGALPRRRSSPASRLPPAHPGGRAPTAALQGAALAANTAAVAGGSGVLAPAAATARIPGPAEELKSDRLRERCKKFGPSRRQNRRTQFLSSEAAHLQILSGEAPQAATASAPPRSPHRGAEVPPHRGAEVPPPRGAEVPPPRGAEVPPPGSGVLAPAPWWPSSTC